MIRILSLAVVALGVATAQDDATQIDHKRLYSSQIDVVVSREMHAPMGEQHAVAPFQLSSYRIDSSSICMLSHQKIC
jgi:hypothetical protein